MVVRVKNKFVIRNICTLPEVLVRGGGTSE